jgi:type I restriction enzyme S subunit
MKLSDVTKKVPNTKPELEPNRTFRYIDISSINNSTNKVQGVRTFLGMDAPSRARRPVQVNDVLLSNVRVNLRNTAMVENDSADICSTGFTVLRTNEKVTPAFLFRFVLSDQFVRPLEELQTGTQYPATSDRIVFDQPIPVPPIETQVELDQFFSKLEGSLITAKDRLSTIPTLVKKFRQSVLAAACSGQLTADWREEYEIDRDGHQLHANLLDQRSQAVKSTKKPAHVTDEPFELPSSWDWSTLEELSVLITDGEHQTPKYTEMGVPFIMIRDLTSTSGIDFSNTAFVSEEDYQVHCKRVKPQRGDLLMTKVGTIGVIREVQTDRPFSLFVSVALIRLTDCTMNNFIKIVLQAPNVQSRMVGTGTGRTNYVLRDIRSLHIPLPPPEEQTEIVRRVESLFALADAVDSRLSEATAQVERTTQAILAKAFRGEL